MSGTQPDESNKAVELTVNQLKGSDVSAVWRQPDGETLPYRCRAEWAVLRDGEKPAAEMFYTSYVQEDVGDRPITFVFNGGPGAASAYLHIGALGTRRVAFAEDGTLLPPPTHLVDNAESWLGFTDLVFVDPVGTGFSRAIEKPDSENKAKEEAGPSPKKPKSFVLGSDLERHSIDELAALKAELERELTRVQEALAKRQSVRAAAEALFRSAGKDPARDD